MAVKAHRSPSAPSKPLDVCLAQASSIFEAYGHASFGKPEIASVLDMASNSGPFARTMASLTQYGLLQKESKDSYIVSSQLKEYLLIPDDDEPALRSRRLGFIKSASFFDTLLTDLKGKVPSPDNLASILKSRYEFNGEKAHLTAKSFYESLAWAGVLDAKGNVLSAPPHPTSVEPDSDGSRQEQADASSVSVADEDAAASSPALNAPLTMEIALSPDRFIEIKYPADMTPQESLKVGAILNALCKEPDDFLERKHATAMPDHSE